MEGSEWEQFVEWKSKRANGGTGSSSSITTGQEPVVLKKAEEEEEEDPLTLVDVASQVVVIGKELGRSRQEMEEVVRVLERNWIKTMADWVHVSKDPIEGLPSLFRVKLEERRVRVLEKEKAALDIGPTLDEIQPTNPEDTEQKRIVEELAAAFEAGEKHKVVVKIFLNNLDNLSSSDQTIEFDMGIQCWFIDESHVGHPEGAPEKDVFKPIFEFMRAVKVHEILEDGGSFYIRNEYRRWGIVNWYQRYRGKLALDLQLHSFPFDEQAVAIRFGMTLFGAENILLMDRTDPKVVESFDKTVDSLHEWSLFGTSHVKDLLVFNEEDQRDISYLEYSVPVKRRTPYYIWNVFVLVYLLSILNWWVLLIDPEVLNDRLQICITCFLALVAFNFVIAESLPRISHSTYISQYFLLNYAMIALIAVESAVVFLVGRYATGGAMTNNSSMSGGPPGVYFSPDAFNTAKIIDWTVLGVAATFQTLVLLFYVSLAFGYFKKRPSRGVAKNNNP